MSGVEWVHDPRDGFAVRPAHDIVAGASNYQHGFGHLLPGFAEVQGLQLLDVCTTSRAPFGAPLRGEASTFDLPTLRAEESHEVVPELGQAFQALGGGFHDL